mmetsp:Transcript_4141/g.7009  ORF Transcript_4141/g.7009 Transcript_4141/m.7009 type:complete len:115 (+) Transcript_4141:310-654(+)|eukprot:CAMPEP_0168621228 /NCGR_PEP_ID=MMETSP0449_2-20121227/7573_1 /TAXON_ID=1082188 /ORGANISM="Strombidium rassoulzadegani, Strain ras09" /LENGTH=114 /DNA_ID=CAMNT_0008662315 /DNA_START=248 /DNA_END=592 /DNA_ORIENTATION=-
MFPNLDVIGWYSGFSEGSVEGSTPAPQRELPDLEADMITQKQIVDLCENPIYLVLRPQAEKMQERNKLPLAIYETNNVTRKFVQLDQNQIQIAQSEDERIAVDHISKAVDSDAK